MAPAQSASLTARKRRLWCCCETKDGEAPGKLLTALRWTAKPPITLGLRTAKPFIVFGLWALNWPLSQYTKGEGLRETTGGFLISKKDAPFFHSTARLMIILALAATSAASVLNPGTKGVTGMLEKLGNLGAEILALVILGTILLVRPYRYIQEVILNEIVKLYERVERRYRPESHRQRADIAEDKIEDLEERNKAAEERAKAAEERAAELERQNREDGSRRRRRRRNSPPEE